MSHIQWKVEIVKNADTIITVRILCRFKKLLISCEYRRSFDLPKDMHDASFFVRSITFQLFRSQHSYFCYEGVVSWFSWYFIVYSATKLKTITVNMAGVSPFCLDYTMWSSWTMEIMQNVHIYTHTHTFSIQLTKIKSDYEIYELECHFSILKNKMFFLCRKGVMLWELVLLKKKTIIDWIQTN